MPCTVVNQLSAICSDAPLCRFSATPTLRRVPTWLRLAHMRRTLFPLSFDVIAEYEATQLAICRHGTIDCERRKGPGLTLMICTPSILLSFCALILRMIPSFLDQDCGGGPGADFYRLRPPCLSMRCMHSFLPQTEWGHGGVTNRMRVVCAITLDGEQSLLMQDSVDSVGGCNGAGGTAAM